MTLTLPIPGGSAGTWGTTLNSALTDLDGRTVGTKKATHCFGSANGSFDFDSAVDWLQRALVVLPVTTTRWRLVVASANAFTGTAANRPTSVASVYVGDPDFPAGGRWAGNCTGSMVAAITSALSVPGSGADATTGWVTDPAAQFAAHRPKVVSMAMSISAGTDDFITSDINAWTAAGSNSYVGTADASAVLAASAIWIHDVRLEYETQVDPSTPVVLVVGASAESGYNPDTPQDPSESWPYQLGLRSGCLVIGCGLGGTGMSAFNSTSNRSLARLDLASTVPDIAVIGTAASNDINAGETLSTLKDMYANIRSALTTLGIPRFYALTVPPRSSLDSGKKTVKNNLNAWLRTLPLGMAGLLDADLLLRDPTSTEAMLAELVCSDSLHPSLAAHQLMGDRFRIA